MDKQDFINEAENLGYTLEINIGDTFKLSRKRSDGARFVDVTVQGDVVQLESKTDKEDKYARYVIGGLWNGFKRLKDLDQEIFAEDNAIMRDPENVRAARLIHEVRTIRLGPDDKLLIQVNEDVYSDNYALQNLANVVGRWLGDKGLHRAIILGKDVEFIGVYNEESAARKSS